MRSILAAMALALSAGVAIHSAQATTLEMTYYYPDLSTVDDGWNLSPSNPFVIGSGPETFFCYCTDPYVPPDLSGPTTPFADVNFTATKLTIEYVNSIGWFSASFNGPVFDVISGEPLGAITSVNGISASLVSDLGSQLSINWAGVSFVPGDTIAVTFSVPEPATWTMLILGLGMCGLLPAEYRASRKRAALAT